jgi:hypothetical protein
MARIAWEENGLINIKLRDDLYTIGPMLVSPTVRFYDISSKDGVWKTVDLNEVKPLFQAYAFGAVKRLAVGRIKDKSVIPSSLPLSPLWIDVHLNYDGSFPWRGGKLVDVDAKGKIGATEAPVIKQYLQLPQDREIIENVELTNLWTEGPLVDRLCRYFDTGVNRDDLKFEVFPDLWDDRERLRPLTRRVPIPSDQRFKVWAEEAKAKKHAPRKLELFLFFCGQKQQAQSIVPMCIHYRTADSKSKCLPFFLVCGQGSCCTAPFLPHVYSIHHCFQHLTP